MSTIFLSVGRAPKSAPDFALKRFDIKLVFRFEMIESFYFTGSPMGIISKKPEVEQADKVIVEPKYETVKVSGDTFVVKAITEETYTNKDRVIISPKMFYKDWRKIFDTHETYEICGSENTYEVIRIVGMGFKEY